MKPNIRVGYGYDVHALAEGVDFWIGGIKVPHTHGAFGHSDADVLIHVICDALLGAANMRDIGFHFSDKDPQYKGIDSKILNPIETWKDQSAYEAAKIDLIAQFEKNFQRFSVRQEIVQAGPSL